jgi:hypothetical protein
MAGLVALFFNGWNLFVRLADPNHHAKQSPAGLCCFRPSAGRPTKPAAPP